MNRVRRGGRLSCRMWQSNGRVQVRTLSVKSALRIPNPLPLRGVISSSMCAGATRKSNCSPSLIRRTKRGGIEDSNAEEGEIVSRRFRLPWQSDVRKRRLTALKVRRHLYARVAFSRCRRCIIRERQVAGAGQPPKTSNVGRQTASAATGLKGAWKIVEQLRRPLEESGRSARTPSLSLYIFTDKH